MRRAILFVLALVGCNQGSASDPLHEVPLRTAPAAFAFVSDGKAWIGQNGALAVAIGDALRLTTRSDSVEVAFACAGRTADCRAEPQRSIAASANRLLLARDTVHEWYVNDPSGFEQGFVVSRRPMGRGPLRVAFRTDRVRGDARSLRLGEHVEVNALAAWDATGRALPAKFVLVDGGFAIDVDDDDASYPVTIDPTYLAAERLLVPSTATAGDGTAGYAVAIDAKGLVAGVPGANVAHAWTRATTGAWSLTQTFAATGAVAGQKFGAAVSLDADTLVVGAPGHTEGTKTGVGAAFVFVRGTTGTFTQQAKLLTSDGLAGDGVGGAVGISANTIVLGVSKRKQAYVFVRSGTTWTEQAKLVGKTTGNYGVAVAVSGDRVVVGDGNDGTGRIHLYQRSGTTWPLSGEIVPTGAKTMDFVGTRLALDGDVLVSGSPFRSDSARSESGTAWIFVRQSTGAWQDVATLAPLELLAGDHFGDAVAVKGGNVVIGAPPHAGSGAVWLYEQGATGTFTLKERILASQRATGDGIGASVATTPGFVVAGAPGNDEVGKTDTGGAFVFEYQSTKANGATCAAAKECTSGVCVDGVCCDRACAGCEACTAALKGSGADGVCAPVPADTDPRSSCAVGAGYPGSCAADGMCDGTGKCRSFAKAGTPCGATTCGSGSVTGKTCLGSEAKCVDATTSCAPYTCGATACKTTCVADTDCVSGAFCTSTGACVAKKPLGESCGATRECASGFCVDGACCNSACTGNCEACDVAGSVGTCAPVNGAPHAARPPCPGGSGTCAGACDGMNGGTCTFPVGKECGASCDANEQTIARCDMAGACKLALPESCGVYTCDDKRCRTSCADDTQCAAKHRCDKGACVPSEGRCSADGLSVTDADGKTAPCGATRCRDGKCLGTCESSADCAPGYLCNATRCEAAGATDDEGGCAFGAPSRTVPGSLLALLTLGIVDRRRRARRKGE